MELRKKGGLDRRRETGSIKNITGCWGLLTFCQLHNVLEKEEDDYLSAQTVKNRERRMLMSSDGLFIGFEI